MMADPDTLRGRGVQRRIEARIGELLGEPEPGKPDPHTDEVSHDQDRADFRVLRHARNGLELTDDEWRKSRRAPHVRATD